MEKITIKKRPTERLSAAMTKQTSADSTFWASVSVGDSNRGYSHGIVSWATLGTPKRFLAKRVDGRKDEVESVLAQLIGMEPGEYVLTATSKSGDQRNANVTIGYNPPRQ